jgi:hypothetical protein
MKQERDILELLILLRDTILTDGCLKGMCLTIMLMTVKPGSISDFEESMLMDYLDAHRPLFRHRGGYWYRKGRVKPRLRWINRQIRRLSRERGSKTPTPTI